MLSWTAPGHDGPVYLGGVIDSNPAAGAVFGPQFVFGENRNISLNFDALNLNDPILKYYGANRDQPRAFYANGRQYYFTVRVKF